MSGNPVRMLLSTLLLALPGFGGAQGVSDPLPPPPDNVAGMRASYEQAVAADTGAALILFIARNPDHPLADAARRDLAARPTADRVSPGGPDGDIILQFDAARLGGRAALDGFAARHPGHPLAVEARRPFWR